MISKGTLMDFSAWPRVITTVLFVMLNHSHRFILTTGIFFLLETLSCFKGTATLTQKRGNQSGK